MTLTNKTEYASPTLSEQAVIEYLEQNPEFFKQHETLLLKLDIEHHTGDAASILQFQINRFRDQNSELHHKLKELIDVARENDRLNERMHHLTLSLIDTTTADEAILLLEKLFTREFHAQWVKVYLFESGYTQAISLSDSLIERNERVERLFENFFKAGRPLCGRLKQEQLEFLFSDNANLIKSSVLLPLDQHGKLGMIAIGSNDQARFHSGMGTIYLNQMAEVITHTFKRFIRGASD